MASMRAGSLDRATQRAARGHRRGVKRALTALAATLPLVALLQGSVGAQDPDAAAAFRPACGLIAADQVHEIVGVNLETRDLGPLFCAFEGEGVAVFVTLDEMMGLELGKMVMPEATELTVAGREALSHAAGEGLPAGVVVALEEAGVLRVQVTQEGNVPADPVAAAVSIAEAIFASGAVLARPPEAESGPSLGFDGSACELVTVDDMIAITGDERYSDATEDSQQSCTYSSADFSLFVNVAITEGELFLFQAGSSVELTVAGRSALWSPDMLNSLFVDIGAGRLLQVALLVAEGSPDELQAMTQAIAELALGRMVEVGDPTPPTAAVAGPACDLLSAADVAAITGLPFSRADDTDSSGESCSYSTDDPANEPWFVIIAQAEMDDPAAALEAFAQDAAGLPEPEAVQVAGQPALRGGNESVAVVVVDLDGLVDDTGKVLAVVWFFPPQGVDAAALAVQLAEAAVGNL